MKDGRIPEIEVGIITSDCISFALASLYNAGSDRSFTGTCLARPLNGRIIIENEGRSMEFPESTILEPLDYDAASFTVHDVLIGVGFHWERKEDQVFRGKLRFSIDGENITLVNILTVEEYLESVISSEMSASSSEALLKAHAVISRGWLLAQMEKRRNLSASARTYETSFRSESEIVRWYDREDHKEFDVCADDHCQRYQGITRASLPIVLKVIKETFGEVLMYDGRICDTRFYKCCGGKTELFENVWEPEVHPYLPSIIDNPAGQSYEGADLRMEPDAGKWIDGNPSAFCNTSDKRVLSQVLNDYDQETNDFFRWVVRYTQQELSTIVKTRTGIDFGEITALVPLERGESGRIKRLRIEGTSKTMVIGKELEIRRSLSMSHLYSSCFYPETVNESGRLHFVLHGAGWGHGVGLCQIGAAVMGDKGYDYRQILMHYFRGADIKILYSPNH